MADPSMSLKTVVSRLVDPGRARQKKRGDKERDREMRRLSSRIEALETKLAQLGDGPRLAGIHPRRTDAEGHPLTDGLMPLLRELPLALRNIKTLGSAMAAWSFDAQAAVATHGDPPHAGLTSRLCRAEDLRSDWFRFRCAQLRLNPIPHRKVWEDCFVVQALAEHDQLRQGRRGLGFAVGRERLPALFASCGADIVATDLAGDDARAAGWSASNEHAGSLDGLHHPDLVDGDVFRERCRFMAVDMTAIPQALHGAFDFCWSVCSFEHLGSAENGLQFVLDSIDCLKPGGIAVHTTEFNADGQDETIDDWVTVLYTRPHMEQLAARLAERGHEMLPISYDWGGGFLDQFIDLPPFRPANREMSWPDPPHLRVSVDGFPCTSIALVIRARA